MSVTDIVLSAQLIIAGTFLVAGVSKLLWRSSNQKDILIAITGMTPSILHLVALLLPFIEIGLGAAMLSSYTLPVGLWGVGVTLIAFNITVIMALRVGYDGQCACFGGSGGRVDLGTFVRNMLLLATCGIAAVLRTHGEFTSGRVIFALEGMHVVTALVAVAFIFGSSRVVSDVARVQELLQYDPEQ